MFVESRAVKGSVVTSGTFDLGVLLATIIVVFAVNAYGRHALMLMTESKLPTNNTTDYTGYLLASSAITITSAAKTTKSSLIENQRGF
jgi:hypothetical protein